MAYAAATSTSSLLVALTPIIVTACLLAVLVLGLQKLASRGTTRMNNGVIITGYLIIAMALVGAIFAQLR